MQRAAVEAGDGVATYADSFEKLGINAESFLKLSADQQFSAMADALSNVANPAERTALAMEVLGRSGASLIPLMEGGAAAIAMAREESEGMGNSLSRLQADQLAGVNDGITRLQSAFAGLATQFAVELSPGLIIFLENLGKVIPPAVAGLKEAVDPMAKLAASINLIQSGNLAADTLTGGRSTALATKSLQAVTESGNATLERIEKSINNKFGITVAQ